MIVMKFGGKSLRDSARTWGAGTIVQERVVDVGGIVVSAHGDTTDRLVRLAHDARLEHVNDIEGFHRDLLRGLGLTDGVLEPEFERLEEILARRSEEWSVPCERLHAILSFGERAAARLFAAHLTQRGLPARPLLTDEGGVVTEDADPAGEGARPLDESVLRLRDLLRERAELPIVTGFIGRDRAGRSTILGRHGSDETAVLVACALGAAEVQIWTDVDGIMTRDPRSAGPARLLERLSFEEARLLLGDAGAPLHPRALRRAEAAAIPLRVLNSSRPSGSGTVIAG